MEIDTRGLLALLGHMHPSWTPAAIEARIKYFMRRGWPSSAVAAGRGARVLLGTDELMKFVLVLELLDAMVPPGPAVAMIDASWRDISEALAGAWVERGRRQAALPILVRTKVGDDGSDGEDEGTDADVDRKGFAVAATGDDVRRWLGGEGSSRWTLVLDAARLMRGLDAAVAANLAPVVARRVATAIDEWIAAR